MIEATVTGNVGRAPEMKTTRSGKQMAGFSVASTEKKDAPTTWVEVVCFDEQADMVCQSLQKGDRVVVTGRMALETFQKKDGSTGFSLRLMANEVGRSLRWPRRSAGAMPEVSEVEEEAAEPIPF
jgi:single-strand DNA-binding protein